VLHFSSRIVQSSKRTAGKNIGATSCVPFVQVSGTVDASWSLLKINEYLVNPE
jgi:hypothetical protein